MKIDGVDHFLFFDTDSAAGFEETAERSAGIVYVANDFSGHFLVVVASPSNSEKYRTTWNFHGQPAMYAIADEAAFLRHMQQCCERTAVAAGMLGTLAGWASGST